MYRIKVDDRPLWTPVDNNLKLGSPTLSLEVNTVGSLSFTIYPDHPQYNDLAKMKNIISVYQDNRVIFKGRIYSDKVDFYKVKKVEVEGLLGYLNDSIVRPYEFTGSVTEYLSFLISQHNDQVEPFQQFKLGVVTVTDPNDYIVRSNTGTTVTWGEIGSKLVDLLGGYIFIRYEDDGNYIDYLATAADTSTQEIRYAVNLLDLTNEVKGDKLATCIIPYGSAVSEESDERLTIESVNNGVDYIQSDEAVAKYGKIYEVVTWDDVTIASNLLAKAKAYLATKILLHNSLTVKAVDLNLADSAIESFRLGDNIRVYSDPHGIDEIMFLTAYKVNLADPSGFTFTLGIEKESFLDSQISSNQTNINRIDEINKRVEEVESKASSVNNETYTYVNDAISNSEEETRTLLEGYTKTSELEEYKQTVSTSFTQTANDFNFKFTEVSDRITTENGEINRQLNDFSKYIRFVDGSIILGEIGNELTTKIANGRISFLYHDAVEVAYISENKLYITNAEILSEIIIGNFAFIPRKNGNLSFKKIK